MAEMGENGQKTIADYGTWSSPITSNLLIGGNCKTINELRVWREGGKKELYNKLSHQARNQQGKKFAEHPKEGGGLPEKFLRNF